MSELLGNKKELLKVLFKDLHQGAEAEEIKRKYEEIIKATKPEDIKGIEEDLVKDGIPKEEIKRIYDTYLADIEKEKSLAPEGHPIHILMEEHRILEEFAADLKDAAEKIKEAVNYEEAEKDLKRYRHGVEHLKRSESHYIREENVLFPYLEKHGITQPPAAMWEQHDMIRDLEKTLYKLGEDIPFPNFANQLKEITGTLHEMLSGHFSRENKVLFPAALRVIQKWEWPDIRKGFDDLGYCCFTPEEARSPFAAEEKGLDKPMPTVGADEMVFDVGALNKKELENILNTLPIDMTFVDAKDEVRYFSQSQERIFPRTKAIIGRQVHNCHPKKSVHVVEQIVKDFKSGARSTADFWINLQGRLILIKYFAIRDKEGEYIGCLEVTQDITDIQKIQGEKRLLD